MPRGRIAHKGRTQLTGTNPSRAGDENQRVVFETIRALGSTTCSEIAAATDLTHQAVINITKRLVNYGVVMEDGKNTGMRGQPAMRFRVNGKGAYALGLNIDREHLILIVMDLLGNVKHRVYRHKPFPLPDDVMEFLETEVAQIFAKRLVPKNRVVGLGIAMPDGFGVLPVEGIPEGFSRWAYGDFSAACSESLGLPVFTENDATSAAIGEHHLGKTGYDSFIYILISAGLGCGLVLNGRPYAGGKNHAGEIGNIPISWPAAHSNKRQILWDAVSLYALYAELARVGITVSSPSELDLSVPGMAAGIDAWIDKAVSHMLLPFLTINYIISPEVAYIGGHLPVFIVHKLCEKLNAAISGYETHTPLTMFQPSTTSVDAAALGAAVLVFQNELMS